MTWIIPADQQDCNIGVFNHPSTAISALLAVLTYEVHVLHSLYEDLLYALYMSRIQVFAL